jgi:hypothetical protein
MISPVRNAGEWTAPGSMTAAQFTYLANIDMDAVEQAEVDAISQYASLWLQSLAPNQPIRMHGSTRAPEVGQATFGDALAAWLAIK